MTKWTGTKKFNNKIKCLSLKQAQITAYRVRYITFSKGNKGKRVHFSDHWLFFLNQGCPNLFLEFYLPAEFSSNPDQTQLNQLIRIWRSTW